MREPGRAARNSWPVVFTPPLDIREVRVRAEAGFGYGPVLEMLEARLAQYAVVARMTAP